MLLKLVWCDACDNLSAQSQCKTKSDLQMIVVNDTNHLKHNATNDIHALIEQSLQKELLVKRCISKKFKNYW